MNPDRSLPSPGFPRLWRTAGLRRNVGFILACLLLAVRPTPATAARANASGGRSSPTAIGRPAMPVLNSPMIGRFSNSDVAERNALTQLDRLASLPGQGYDIVPPEHANPSPGGPLPGYQIVRLGRGHLNRLCLAATIAGTKGLMMLDTGANTSSLSDATYRSLLLDSAYKLPAGLPRSVNLNGTSVPLAEAPNFFVGKSNLGAVPVSVIPRRYLFDSSPRDGAGRSYDGLIGENILRHYNAIVDCGRLVLYLNLDPARKANLSSSFVRNGWTRVPMSDAGNDFTVPCVLRGHRFRLIVDTGSPFTNLDRNLLSAAQIESRDLDVSGGLIATDSRKAGLVDLDQMQIGDYTVTNVHMTATTQSLADFDRSPASRILEPIVGLLGGDTLAGNNAVVDIGNKALYLKHSGGKVASR